MSDRARALTPLSAALVRFLEAAVGRRFAFAFLAPGPALGIVAMLRLRAIQSASSSWRNEPPPIVRSA